MLEKKGKKRKEIPHPNLKGKKPRHAEHSHWLHEILFFQNCLSPFLAWANSPIINWGYFFF
jgi:hypothetical protein